MKKILYLAVSCAVAGPAWGQPVPASPVSSSLRVSTAVEAPKSNIDLLKASLQSSPQKVVGSADAAAAKPAEPAVSGAPAVSSPVQAGKPSLPSSSAPAAAQPVPAAPSVPAPAKQPLTPSVSQPAAPAAVPPAKTASSATTLAMPLEMGGSTQTVQTSVEPVKKPLSPAAAKRVAQSKRKRAAAQQSKAAAPTELEKDIEKSNALLPASSQTAEPEAVSEEEAAADAELEYAVKMLEETKQAAQSAGRKILPSASQNKPKTVPAPNKKFNPNAFRPGVTWLPSKSTHFDIYTQKRASGITSSNMAMTFESAYQTLRRFIPWMMSGRVRVFVYQDHDSYLRHEPNAKPWSGALAYPTRGEIVVYDSPNNNQQLKESFTHELTHIFTQQFFDKHKTGRIMTPNWLDEGLAVMMEDQAYNGSKGGPWADDFNTRNFQRDPSDKMATFGSSSMFGSSAKRLTSKRPGKPVYFTPFNEFMEEGSLASAEGRGKEEDWYFQAYTMVRFLLNPAGGASPSNRMQFQQFTTLMSEGEPVRDPATGFLKKDSRGKTVYQPYSVEKALGRAYRYNSIYNYEDAFWNWAGR